MPQPWTPCANQAHEPLCGPDGSDRLHGPAKFPLVNPAFCRQCWCQCERGPCGPCGYAGIQTSNCEWCQWEKKCARCRERTAKEKGLCEWCPKLPSDSLYTCLMKHCRSAATRPANNAVFCEEDFVELHSAWKTGSACCLCGQWSSGRERHFKNKNLVACFSCAVKFTNECLPHTIGTLIWEYVTVKNE